MNDNEATEQSNDDTSGAGRRVIGRRALMSGLGAASAMLAAPSVIGTAASNAAAAPEPQATRALSATVDELRALTAPAADVVYYVVDATEAGAFVYDRTDTTSADDGATVLVSTQKAIFGSQLPRYKRLGTDGVYHVTWFGAAGDGTTDDADAFTAALAATGISTLVVPAGTYKMSKFIVVPSGVGVDYHAGAVIPSAKLIDATLATRRMKFADVAYAPQNVAPYKQYDASEQYFFDPLFHVLDTDNQQGLTYWDGYYYVGFDMGGGNSMIRQYTAAGVKTKQTPLLPLGHVAEIAYRTSNGHIYACTGGGTFATQVSEVDFGSGAVVSTLDLSALGNSALIAIDNERDLLLVHAGANDSAPPTFTLMRFDGTTLHQFTIPNQGTPQGLDTTLGQIFFYTTGKITVLDYNGTILGVIPVPKSGENEGLTISGDYFTPSITVGYNNPNRLYTLRTTENLSVFHSYQPFGPVNATNNNRSLVPKIFTLALNTNNGTGKWAPAGWSNGYNFGELVKSISVSSTAVTINLRTSFDTVGHYNIGQNFALYGAGLRAAMNATSNSQLTVQFYDTTNAVVNPTTVAAFSTVTILVIGAISLYE